MYLPIPTIFLFKYPCIAIGIYVSLITENQNFLRLKQIDKYIVTAAAWLVVGTVKMTY